MGLSGGDGVKVENSEVGKLKGRKKKDKGSDVEDIGCWTKLRFIGSCISSRSILAYIVTPSPTGTEVLTVIKIKCIQSKRYKDSQHLSNKLSPT